MFSNTYKLEHIKFARVYYLFSFINLLFFKHEMLAQCTYLHGDSTSGSIRRFKFPHSREIRGVKFLFIYIHIGARTHIHTRAHIFLLFHKIRVDRIKRNIFSSSCARSGIPVFVFHTLSSFLIGDLSFQSSPFLSSGRFL